MLMREYVVRANKTCDNTNQKLKKERGLDFANFLNPSSERSPPSLEAEPKKFAKSRWVIFHKLMINPYS